MDQLFEQYKLVLESREKSIDRITTLNTLYLSILSGIFISSTLIIEVVKKKNNDLPFDKYFYLLVLITSIFISYVWKNALIHRSINIKSKTKVILELEDKMEIKPTELELKFQELEIKKLKFNISDEFAPNIFLISLICLFIIYVSQNIF